MLDKAKKQRNFLKPIESSTKGFTLIEIMIAVAIFSLISFMTIYSVKEIVEKNAILEKHSTKLASLQRMFVYMENDFRYMVQRTIRDPLDGLSFDPSFSVNTDDDELVKFFTLSPDANTGESQTRLVAWVLDGDKLQRKTWFSISPYTDEEPRLATIVEEVDEVDLRFAEEKDEVLEWRSDWDDDEQLPLAAEIVVNFSNGDNYRRVFEIADTPQFPVPAVQSNNQNPSGNPPAPSPNPGGPRTN